MRGADERQAVLFSYRSIEGRVPADHPLRAMRRLIDPLLVELSPRFQALYSAIGRPSIPPEQLLRALLLQVLYTIRSERQLMEQLDYNLLYRWFVGLAPDDPVWVPTVFTKNRDRLLEGNIAEAFFDQVTQLADRHALLSHEHFTVDGTLLEAWASHKSFQPVDGPPPPSDGDPGNPSVNYRGQERSNATHRSTTDPDTRLARKTHHGAAVLAYQASVVTENRHGLIVQTDVRAPAHHAERDAAVEMLTLLPPRARRRALGADRGYDAPDFITDVCARGIRGESTEAQAGRRRLWLAEMRRAAAETASSGPGESRVDLHLHERGIQSRATPHAAGHMRQPPVGPDGLARLNRRAAPANRTMRVHATIAIPHSLTTHFSATC